MASIEFTWDSRDLAMWRGGKVDGALKRALRLAGNQAIRLLQRDATALARSRKALPETTITDDQSLYLPSRSAELRDFAWKLFVQGRPVPVAMFPHLDTRRTRSRDGVLVRFGTGGTQRLRSAFVARMKSGHVGVFRRDGRFGRRGNPKLERISELFSSRLPKNYGSDVMLTLG